MKQLNLHNVETFVGDVADFSQPFDVGVALHFCGPLTDLAHQKCIALNAAYVLCPCCYGKTGINYDMADLCAVAHYPRSSQMQV